MPEIARLDGWPDLLLAEVERHATQPFAYGESDCLSFPLDCVKAMTGEDLFAPHRGTYSTALGAAKAMRDAGFETMGDALAAHFEEIAVSVAQRGDLGIVQGEGPTVGVVFVDAPLGKDHQGIRRVSRSLVTRAFKVP